MEELDHETRARIEEEIKAAMKPIMAQHNISVQVKIWRDDERKGSNIIAFKR
jgi:aspartyl aminopeptidase